MFGELEAIGLGLLVRDTGWLVLITYLVIGAGFAAGWWWVRHSTVEFGRGSHLPLYACLAVGFNVIPHLMGAAAGLGANVFVPLQLVLLWGLSLPLGFGLGIISVFRARHAFGSDRAAILALIPIANLVLLFHPKEEARRHQADREDPLRAGAGGVWVALGVFAIAVIVSAASPGSGYNQADDRGALVDLMLEHFGLDGTIRVIAEQGAGYSFPSGLGTFISDVDAAPGELQLTVQGARGVERLDELSQQDVAAVLCEQQLFDQLMEAGAEMNVVLEKWSTEEIAAHRVNATHCSQQDA